MKLLSSLKQKKRYVVFEIVSDKKFSLTDIKKFVDENLQNFLGELGMAKAAPMFLKERFNKDSNKFMVKVNNKYVDELKMALALGKKIKNEPVIIKSIITSGTIKKATSFCAEK